MTKFVSFWASIKERSAGLFPDFLVLDSKASMMIDFSREVTPTGVLVVKLSGRLDFEACDYFFKCMQDEIENGFHQIVVDCESLGYLSSAGIGMLVRARGRVKKQSGFIFLAQLQSGVADLMHFLHMDKVFRIYPTVSEAIDAVDADTSAVE